MIARLIARRVFRSDWPLDKVLWKKAHMVVGWFAWNFAAPPGPEWGRATRINRAHPLWRLNDWVASHWVTWWVEKASGYTREGKR